MNNAMPTRPTEWALATYGSLLRKPWLGALLALALAALIVVALRGFYSVFSAAKPATLRVTFLALLVAGVISIAPVLILRWLDRREPEPWFMYGLTFLWGGVIAVGIAVPLNEKTNLLGVPFIEEAAKGLGLLTLLMLLRSEFDGPRDGIIYGALIGLGFNWLEFAEYVANGYVTSGQAPWTNQITSRYGLLGLSGHALYTAITGSFIGFSLLHKSLIGRVALVLLGYFLASLAHVAWDTIGIFVLAIVTGTITSALLGEQAAQAAGDNLPFWVAWLGNLGGILVVNFVPLVIAMVGLRRSGGWEKRTMVEQLKEEVGTPIVTAEEYTNIAGRCEPPPPQPARQIFRTQCRLAKRKFYLALHGLPFAGDPLVEAWRNEVLALRRG